MPQTQGDKRSLEFLLARKHYQVQEEEIQETQDVWEHIQHFHEHLRQIREATAHLDPNVKYWQETLSTTKEIVIRREHRTYYAMFFPIATMISVSWGAIVNTPTFSVSGWEAIGMPDGAKIILQSGNTVPTQPVLVVVSNVPYVTGTAVAVF